MSSKLPGCFGLTICYNEKSKTCQECPIRKNCHKQVLKAVKQLNEHMDMEALIKRWEPKKPKQKVRKPQKTVSKTVKQNFMLTVNSKQKRYSDMELVILDEAEHSPLTRERIEQIIRELKPQIKESSLQSQTSRVITTFRKDGLIRRDKGIYSLMDGLNE